MIFKARVLLRRRLFLLCDSLIFLFLTFINRLLHLIYRHCTLHVNPLAFDEVTISLLKDLSNAADFGESDKAEAPRFVRALVMQNDTIF